MSPIIEALSSTGSLSRAQFWDLIVYALVSSGTDYKKAAQDADSLLALRENRSMQLGASLIGDAPTPSGDPARESLVRVLVNLGHPTASDDSEVSVEDLENEVLVYVKHLERMASVGAEK